MAGRELDIVWLESEGTLDCYLKMKITSACANLAAGWRRTLLLSPASSFIDNR